MRVEIAKPAEDDLVGIALYISKDSPQAASAFVDELEAACEQLAEHPRRFPVIRKRRSLEIRRRVCGSYLILYLIEDDRIFVLRVLHGAMDYEKLLDDLTP